MDEKPKLRMSRWVKGEAMAYECSLCGQTFLLPEDQPPKEGVAEVWAAFNDHVRNEHPDWAGG
jgi:hypothetical protein